MMTPESTPVFNLTQQNRDAGEGTVSHVGFVRRSLDSLRDCGVSAGNFVAEYFVRAFNHWYRPLALRGYVGPMAPVFDIGLQLVQPGVGAPAGLGTTTKERGLYVGFLRDLAASPTMTIAQAIWAKAPEPSRPEIEQILIESVVRSLAGVWGTEGVAGVSVPPSLPVVEGVEGSRQVRVRTATGGINAEPLDLIIPPLDDTNAPACYPVPVGYPQHSDELPSRLAVFMAAVACHTRHVKDRLDKEVVDACLDGPNRRPETHEPPRLYRTVLETRTKSNVPGIVGGVTRTEIKSDQDRLIDVIPPDWAKYKVCEEAFWDDVLNNRVFVFKREHEQDLVPKHRALVTFVVEAGSDGEPIRPHPSVRRFRNAYVYAKRQLFDLTRDLREAVEKLRNQASLTIDVAVFALRAYREDAVVARMFRLDDLPPRRSSIDVMDRLLQMIQFNTLVSGFFDRLAIQWSMRGERDDGDLPVGVQIDPQLDRFLERQAHRPDPYHAIYIVPIGSEDQLMDFVPAAIEHYRLGSIVRQRVMLIAVNPYRPDADPRLVGEPAWMCGEAMSLHEAGRVLGDTFLRERPLAELRRQFVEMVLGPVKGRGGSLNRVVRLA